jgi:hypothetical protein
VKTLLYADGGERGWYASRHPGRIAWGDGLAAVILVVLWVMATDWQKNVSALRVRLPALEHAGERARELEEDRKAEQARWKP